MKLSSCGALPPVWGTPMRMRPRGPLMPPSEGRPKTTPSRRPQISGSPGFAGLIHGDSCAIAEAATPAMAMVRAARRTRAERRRVRWSLHGENTSCVMDGHPENQDDSLTRFNRYTSACGSSRARWLESLWRGEAGMVRSGGRERTEVARESSGPGCGSRRFA